MYSRWRLTFAPTGNVYEASTPEGVLRRLSKAQFTPEAKRDIKSALAWRAWTLGYNVDETQDDQTFLIAYAATGLATLEVKDRSRGWLTY
jgi:hypothetical protein